MKPFLTGRAHVHVATSPVAARATSADAAPPTAATPDAPAGPRVECIKQGDKVVRLVVTCACGERIEIDCLYPAGG